MLLSKNSVFIRGGNGMRFIGSGARKHASAVPFLDYSKVFLSRHLHMGSACKIGHNNENCEITIHHPLSLSST